MEPIVKLKDVRIIYNYGKSNEYEAIKGVNIEIYPQETIIFFGPSGCGKSTILYSILGVLPPTFGELTIKGENPYSFNQNELVRFQQKTVGIVYQAFYLIPSLNIIDNVVLPQIFSNISPHQREKRGLYLLKRFGVGEQAKKLPTALSGGQSQRVAVARALVNNPEIVLADEPVGNLDSLSAKRVLEAFRDINEKDKKTLIMVTHNPSHLPLAHRVYYLKDGLVSREVINPEKKQIKPVKKGTTLVTEVERLARLYPYLPPAELKVKSIVNFLTQKMTFEQIERFESLVKLAIEGKISIKQFEKIIADPFYKGGVDIPKQSAVEMAQQLKRILDESINIRRFRRSVSSDGKEISKQGKIIKKLRATLLDEYEGNVTPLQVKRLEEAIKDRLEANIQHNEFYNILNTSIKDGGVGFKRKTAKKLSFYLEKLIAQSV